jgi:hypothetical protein
MCSCHLSWSGPRSADVTSGEQGLQGLSSVISPCLASSSRCPGSGGVSVLTLLVDLRYLAQMGLIGDG